MLSIRMQLKEREERREKKTAGVSNDLPEGVTRYVRLGKELADGKVFVMLADPDDWYFYFVHEDSSFAKRETYVRKHTCLHSPRKPGASLADYDRPNKDVCLSCSAKAKRKLYFMVPVFDPQYGTWRILDLKEFHATNLIADYDKLEKSARKFNKNYTLVGDAVRIFRTNSTPTTYGLESAEVEDDVLEAAKEYIGYNFDYETLANFRSEEDIRNILKEASDEHVDKSVLGDGVDDDEVTPIKDDEEVNPEDLF